MTLRWSLLLLTIVVGLSACSSQAPVADGADVAIGFLDQVRAGKVDEAWETTTAEFKSAKGKEAFRKVVKQEPILKQRLSEGDQEELSIGNLKRLKVSFEPKSGGGKHVEILLASENGEWKVDSLAVK
jgi:hypothetical protein